MVARMRGSIIKINSLVARFMVGLIVKPELKSEMDVDLRDDKDVDRYYYYICNGVNTIQATSMDEDVTNAIFDLVSDKLRARFSDFTDNLMIEIKEEFMKNMKKAIVEFALTDPFEEHLVVWILPLININ